MVLAAVPYKVVILLLFIHCMYMYLLPLCVGFVLGPFCGVVHGVLSSLAIIILKKRQLVSLLSCDEDVFALWLWFTVQLDDCRNPRHTSLYLIIRDFFQVSVPVK